MVGSESKVSSDSFRTASIILRLWCSLSSKCLRRRGLWRSAHGLLVASDGNTLDVSVPRPPNSSKRHYPIPFAVSANDSNPLGWCPRIESITQIVGSTYTSFAEARSNSFCPSTVTR